jgi:hypothetical protein
MAVDQERSNFIWGVSEAVGRILDRVIWTQTNMF